MASLAVRRYVESDARAQRNMKTLPCTLFALLVGCGSEVEAIGPEVPSDVEIVAVPPKERPPPKVEVERADPPSRLDGWTLPHKAGPTLGSVCTAASAQPSAGTPPADVCGSRQRVALELQGSALQGKPPCELRSLEGDMPKGMYIASGCVDGDHLVLNTVCLVCRSMDAGNAAHALLSDLTPSQHDQLRKLVNLKADGPTTPAAWRELVTKAPLKDPVPKP